MVKIKVKKQMNLAELLNWAWQNKVRDKLFFSSDAGTVNFNEIGGVSVNAIRQDTTFVVEVEEGITEETEIPTLIELFESDYGQIIHMYYRASIKDAIGNVDEEAKALSKAFYMLNDDMTMTLIWRNGEMVE